MASHTPAGARTGSAIGMSRQNSADSGASLLGVAGGNGNGTRPRYGPRATSPSYAYGTPSASSSGRSSPAHSSSHDHGIGSASLNSRGGYHQNMAASSPWGEKSLGGPSSPIPGNLAPTMGDKFSLSPNPALWGADVSPASAEPDDYLHNPDPKRDRRADRGGTIFTLRGLANIGCIVLLVVILLTLFAGYPIITAVFNKQQSTLGGFNLGGINATGQVGATIAVLNPIDPATPQYARTHTSLETGKTWDLIFSDEFNTDGRTFWPGDDPYWEAENMHYWSTNNLNWYNPVNLATKGGYLNVTLAPREDHGLNLSGGMMTTWNKFCFRGGYVESSVSLPGRSDVYGLWPAIWAMGNLGRAGYGGTLDGMWPYTYNECDVGTLKNQSLNGKPEVALTTGDAWEPYNGTLSYLSGQRLSRCTCANDLTHPGPKNSDGTFMGRSAPEIDMFEAQTDTTTLIADVSQSAQWAPFNPYYEWINNSQTYTFYDPEITRFNSYLGGAYQQAASGLTHTDQNCYTGGTGCFSIYGFEYAPGDKGYVTWVSNAKKSWTVRASGFAPNADAQIGQRPVPYEPMYLLINVGISPNFGAIDWVGLEPLWPVTMLVDYIRVYQDPKNHMIGCDPPDMPTASYINMYADAYTNPNITTFDQTPNVATHPWPKNSLIDTC